MSILYYRTFGSTSMVSLTFSILSGASTILVLSKTPMTRILLSVRKLWPNCLDIGNFQ